MGRERLFDRTPKADPRSAQSWSVAQDIERRGEPPQVSVLLATAIPLFLGVEQLIRWRRRIVRLRPYRVTVQVDGRPVFTLVREPQRRRRLVPQEVVGPGQDESQSPRAFKLRRRIAANARFRVYGDWSDVTRMRPAAPAAREVVPSMQYLSDEDQRAAAQAHGPRIQR